VGERTHRARPKPYPSTDAGAAPPGISIHLQPIIDAANGVLVAAEALARFDTGPTEDVLAAAHLAGKGVELELACLVRALNRRGDLPPGVRLSVNVSPDVVGESLRRQVWPNDLAGVIVEVTEHVSTDHDELVRALDQLRRRGAAIALDDVSTGYAGLLRLAQLRPDFVKVDRRVIAGVRDSAAQTAVLEALVGLTHRIGAQVIGEGVENLDDISAMAEFDVDLAQGYGVSRPGPSLQPIAPDVVAACLAGRRRLLSQAAHSGLIAATTRDMHAVTASLARAVTQADLAAALAQAALKLGVDDIGLSLLDYDDVLREVVASGGRVDSGNYALAQYPATRTALTTDVLLEVQVEDPSGDGAERALLARLGFRSLLLVPLRAGGEPLGILELAHRSPRRWSSTDIAHARGLGEHVSQTIVRVNRLPVP
jgi:EAL domain-containing protein (putative c-di-GMP-specific phosphodiesterase class I)